jgi:hypothetical protein
VTEVRGPIAAPLERAEKNLRLPVHCDLQPPLTTRRSTILHHTF